MIGRAIVRWVISLVALSVVSLVTADAQAWPRIFGRRNSGYSGGGYSGGYSTSGFMGVPAGCHNSTAQGVAECMARCGRVGHFGGNRGYEGCGMASSPQQAYAICCYANSGMKTIDVGYAQGANGMWYCCRRYAN